MKPFVPRAPVIMGAIMGTFGGTLVLLAVLALFSPDSLDRPFADVSTFLMMSALIVPVSAFGIVIFGYPAAGAVGRAWRAPWVGLAALAMGGIAGLIVRITLTAVVAGGIARAEAFAALPVDPGIIYGACVGLAYWLFERDWRLRDAERRAAEGPGEEVPSAEEFSRLP